MRKLLSTSLLLAAISTCVQADGPFDHPRQRNGLSDLLAALEGAQLGGAGAKNGNGENAAHGNGGNDGQGGKGNGQQGGQAEPKTVTVTQEAQQAASNQTCEAIKTVTKTVSVPGVAAAGTGGLQLSFVTETAFASGPAPTVTVTPLAQFITQMVTITVNGANAAEPSNVPAGVNPPAGAAGTGGTGSTTAGIVKTSNPAQPDIASGAATVGVNPPSGAAGTGTKTAAIVKTSDPTRPDVASGATAPGVNPPSGVGGTGSTAAIVKTNNPAVGNTPTAAPVAASQPPVGSPGAMASGVGTLVAGGACDCSCLCGPGSFPNIASAGGIGEMGQAPVATTLSTAAIVLPGTPQASSPQNTPAAAQPQVGNSATLSSAAIVQTGQPGTPTSPLAVPQSQVASSSALPSAQPQVIDSATSSSTAIVETTTSAQGATTAQSAEQSPSGASTLELSVSAPLGQAAALAKPSSTVPQINISTFSLTSSLILGSLATPKAKA